MNNVNQDLECNEIFAGYIHPICQQYGFENIADY